MSNSFLPLCWEWVRSISKATVSFEPWRSIRMPLARSITARRPNAPSRLWYSAKRRRAISDRALQMLPVTVCDVAEHTTLRRFAYKVGVTVSEKGDHRAGSLMHDLRDVLQRVLRALTKTD